MPFSITIQLAEYAINMVKKEKLHWEHLGVFPKNILNTTARVYTALRLTKNKIKPAATLCWLPVQFCVRMLLSVITSFPCQNKKFIFTKSLLHNQ